MRKKKMKSWARLLIFTFIISILPLPLMKPYVVQAVTAAASSASSTDLVNEIVGPGITASNITFTGNPAQGAVFTGASFLPFSDGIVLSTGNASKVFSNTSDDLSTRYNGAGDADLTGIYQSQVDTKETTHDAASLQFSVTPTSNKLSFRYIFASVEYDQPPMYNDVFALYVGGQNIAKLPDGNTVSIKNIRGTPYYIDNSTGSSFKFLGYTTELSCEAAVTPNVPVTIRLVIADAYDDVVDSAVFVKADSINFAPVLSNDDTSAIAGDNLSATSSKDGSIYLVPKGTYSDKAALDGASPKKVVSCSANTPANIDTTGLTPGTYQMYAVDSINMVSAPSNDITITAPDTTPPTFTVSGNPSEWTNSNVTLSIAATDDRGLNTAGAYSFDGGQTWQTGNTKAYDSNISGIIIKVRDAAGNIAVSDPININKIDKTAPEITGASESSSYYIGRVINYKDDSGEIAKATYQIGTGTETPFKSGDLFEAEGSYKLTLVDKAGNKAALSFEIKALPKVEDVVYSSSWKKLIDDIRSEFNSHNDLPETYKTTMNSKIKALEDKYAEQAAKTLPQTGYFFDFNLLIMTGAVLIATGALLVWKRSKRNRTT